MSEPAAHGGNLTTAIRTFGGCREAWLDLSTGINPTPYPFAAPPAHTWARLPDDAALDALRDAASRAYAVASGGDVVVGAGTQAIIAALPYCRSAGDVAVVGFTYAEHALAWRRAGHRVVHAANLEAALAADVVVLTNPNNPDGYRHAPVELLRAGNILRARAGLLVVDEAFADVDPGLSIAGASNLDGIVVTRSFGKFFGLAGIRMGFAISQPDLAQRLRAQLGPWPAAGPGVAVATAALQDTNWQQTQRAKLATQGKQLRDVLSGRGLRVIGHTDLFALCEHPQAHALWTHLAQQHILVRKFDEQPTWLRFGLAANADALERLDRALANYRA